MALALAAAPDNIGEAAEVAAARWGAESRTARALKSAIAAAGTGNWGGPLIGDYAEAVAEFVGLVREQTIVGRLQGLRRVPPNTAYLAQVSGATGNWVAEGAAMPISAMSFTRQTLGLLKVTAVAVQTRELMASPDAETTIRDDLVRAVAAASDAAFINPTNAGVAGETPAAVTYGAPQADIAAALFDADYGSTLSVFTGDWSRAFWIAHPEWLANINSMEHPNCGPRGGELRGLPVIPSSAVPVDSNGFRQVILIDPTAIAYASADGAAQLKATRQGSIEMVDTAPTGDTLAPTGGTDYVSVWQTNCVALAALLWENWRVERDGAVVVLNTAPAS